MNKKKFLLIKNRVDLAEFLEISVDKLLFNAYNEQSRYYQFSIRKKSGGDRIISAPIPSLKSIQKKIAKELAFYYNQKKQVHSYIKGRSIKTNASIHKNQKTILNIDLKDFFPSINFGRVRGVFLNYPFFFNEEVSNILAQISCYNNELPQGSPTSPIISNYICRSLDKSLMSLAKKNKCYYSRYSDDITISSNLKKFPINIAQKINEEIIIGEELKSLIESNGFKIKNEKVSLRKWYENQYVTGLTVNEKVNVKRHLLKKIRAILHAWEVYGLNKAAAVHFKKYNSRNESNPDVNQFINIIQGYLLFIKDIRGENDNLFKSLLNKYNSLTNHSLSRYMSHQGDKIKIYTEGNCDWIHLKSALDSLSVIDLSLSHVMNSIEIVEYDNNYSIGDSKLRSILEGHLLSKNTNPIIGIFDSDNIQKIGEFLPKKNSMFKYRNYENIVYSFSIPQPFHRKIKDVCIEHYYTNSDLQIKDEFGRRIYLSSEFDSTTGLLKLNNDIRCKLSENKLNKPEYIIDNNVYNGSGESIALSKKDFALNIQNRKENFKEVNFKHFKLIFGIIRDIVRDHNKNKSQSK